MFDRFIQHLLQEVIVRFYGNYHHSLPVSEVTPDPQAEGTPEERARQLVNEMTLAEKISYISGIDTFSTKEIPRLGIPYIYMADATSGVRCFGESTNFPAAVAMAATWNRELITEVGEAIGEECRAKGAGILLGPGVNIARVPTCGRNFEYMGEDPYLAGEIAAAYIEGVQSKGIITTVKHFACNNSDYDRHKSNSIVDERTLHEIYLPAFKKAITKAKSMGIMSAYNQINGTYASENPDLLQHILREQWGFDGFVVSDWNSLYSTEGPIKNGLDLEMPGAKWLSEKRVKKALETHKITEDDLNRMIGNLLKTFIKAGLFDRTQIDPKAELKSKRHQSIAARTADEAIVLLKNDRDLLPLGKQRRIAILGNNGLTTATGGGGSAYLLPEEGMHSIYDAIRLNHPDTEVQYIESKRGMVHKRDVPYIVKADAVIVATGFDRFTESESYDRSWKIPGHEQRLIEQMATINRNCIVILHGGGDMATNSWIDHIPAVLHAMYLGQEAGEAIERMLFGRTNPSGRLPFTMAREYEDHEATRYYEEEPHKIQIKRIHGGQGNPDKRAVTDMAYQEGLKVGYRGFEANDIKPLFPFGYGLSYTKFSLTKLEIKKEEEKQFPITVSCTVKNTGSWDGSSVVQLYIHQKESKVFRPQKELKNFTKIALEAGRQKKISMELTQEDFQYYDEKDHQWMIEPGEFTILIGVNSSDIRLQKDIDIR